MRYFLELAFDGGEFHGWQIQENAVTVQEVLDKALTTVLRQKIETVGCGRTDAGVHAKQFFVHFDFDEAVEETFTNRVNALLPHSVVVKRLINISDDAHARFDATQRQYSYYIHWDKDPFLVNRSWWNKKADRLDVDKMNQVAQQMLGFKDFSCFSKSHTQTKTNNCDIKRAVWTKEAHQLVFTIIADRFLRNMVRAIVGTLIEVGEGKVGAQDFEQILNSKSRSSAGTSVPACGLYLEKVIYPYING